MSLSQMQVFNQYLMPVLAEIYPQEIQKFNAASNGAIVLQSAGFDGDFFRESFYNALHSAQRRVDRYAAQAAAAATDLTQSQQSMVKVAGGFMLQVLPGASEEEIARYEKRIQEMPAISTLLESGLTQRKEK